MRNLLLLLLLQMLQLSCIAEGGTGLPVCEEECALLLSYCLQPSTYQPPVRGGSRRRRPAEMPAD